MFRNRLSVKQLNGADGSTGLGDVPDVFGLN